MYSLPQAVEYVLRDVLARGTLLYHAQVSKVLTDSCPSNNLVATCGNGRKTQPPGHIF